MPRPRPPPLSPPSLPPSSCAPSCPSRLPPKHRSSFTSPRVLLFTVKYVNLTNISKDTPMRRDGGGAFMMGQSAKPADTALTCTPTPFSVLSLLAPYPFQPYSPPFRPSLSIWTYANLNTPSPRPSLVGGGVATREPHTYVSLRVGLVECAWRFGMCAGRAFEWGLNIVHEYFASSYLKEREALRAVRYDTGLARTLSRGTGHACDTASAVRIDNKKKTEGHSWKRSGNGNWKFISN